MSDMTFLAGGAPSGLRVALSVRGLKKTEVVERWYGSVRDS